MTITTHVTLGADAIAGQVINFSIAYSGVAPWTHSITQSEVSAGNLNDVHAATINAGNYTLTATVTSGPNNCTRNAPLSVP